MSSRETDVLVVGTLDEEHVNSGIGCSGNLPGSGVDHSVDHHFVKRGRELDGWRSGETLEGVVDAALETS